MKKLISSLATGVVLVFALNACQSGSSDSTSSFEAIEKGFRQVPDSIHLANYWYWISDNISKEGIERDLEAMKAAGIRRAYIGNVSIEEGIPYGDVKMFTPTWWEAIHTALKKATELDMEIGIFNSPGWSQSGGPWIKPEQSMRYLASEEVRVQGGRTVQLTLPNLAPGTQRVRVIAYPTTPEKEAGVYKTWLLDKKKDQMLTLDLSLGQSATIRSFVFTTQSPIRTEAELQVKEGTTYRSLKRFSIDRSNPALNVGFHPFAPIVISLPETSAADFRLVLNEQGAGKAEVSLSSSPMVERYAEKSLAKMFPTPLPMWGDYLWEPQPVVPQNACVDPQRVIDLTAQVSASGGLAWDAPEGEWIVSQTYMQTTGVTNAPASPDATGLEVDKMSGQHAAAHFDAYMGEILRRIPEADRKSFKIVVQDSYETGGQNWTDDMIEKFEQTYGYSPLPYLPVLRGVVVGSPDRSDRFLWDLRRLVADRVAYDYVASLRRISNQHGLTTWLENYGHWGFPGEFLQYGGQSDEIGGEFWSEGTLGDIENRAASSCGHIYGKRKVWAESCTSGGPVFSRYPYTMKQRIDRFFTEGINSTLLHLYIHQPFEDREPGLDAWFGNEFNRKNTWYSQMDVFSDYLKRCNFLLQQGLYVADVAYFIGEDAPKMTGICQPELPKGYSFDYINAEVLLTRATMKDGKLTLPDGMQYRLLVLPQLETMRPQLLRKLKALINDGLVVLGPAPKRSPSLENYPQADTEVQQLAAELWGNSSAQVTGFGKGKVYADGHSIEQVFSGLGVVPDVGLPHSQESPVLFIHRTVDGGEIYFLSNQSDQRIAFEPAFRVTGKVPELWNLLTEEIRYLPEFKQDKTATSVPMVLEPFESVCVVFRKSGTAQANPKKNFPDKEVLLTLDTPWQVSFEKGKRGPDEVVSFPVLQDWTASGDERIRYFSGTAHYKNTFVMDQLPDRPLYVDLGKVMVMARVKLNGKTVGGVWTYPYRLNITGLLQKGENVLEVEVVNNWMNRLIGDQQLPESERKTWTNVNPWKADSPLQSSGLLGPVEIQGYSYIPKKN